MVRQCSVPGCTQLTCTKTGYLCAAHQKEAWKKAQEKACLILIVNNANKRKNKREVRK